MASAAKAATVVVVAAMVNAEMVAAVKAVGMAAAKAAVVVAVASVAVSAVETVQKVVVAATVNVATKHATRRVRMDVLTIAPRVQIKSWHRKLMRANAVNAAAVTAEMTGVTATSAMSAVKAKAAANAASAGMGVIATTARLPLPTLATPQWRKKAPTQRAAATQTTARNVASAVNAASVVRAAVAAEETVAVIEALVRTTAHPLQLTAVRNKLCRLWGMCPATRPRTMSNRPWRTKPQPSATPRAM